MSHFPVAVFMKDDNLNNLDTILNNLDTILAPYYEDFDEDSPYTEWEESDNPEEEGYWYNPNAKWDWWQVGGRWGNMLRLKDGTRRDWAPVSECDFTPDKDRYDYAIRYWEINVEGKPKVDDDKHDYFCIWGPEYYTQRYANKEAYAESEAKFSPWAFVDENGEWYEKGSVGWWATDDASRKSITIYEELFDAYLKYAAENSFYIVIVDCHI